MFQLSSKDVDGINRANRHLANARACFRAILWVAVVGMWLLVLWAAMAQRGGF